MNNYSQNILQTKGYKIENLLGKGGFGQVFKGLKIDNQLQVAIKMIELERFPENGGIFGELVKSEIEALKLIKSDHVIGYVDTFQDNIYCYIIMEYCNSGDLYTLLKNPNFKITEQDALGIFKQILKGLKDLHSNFIIHRDLKVQNILVHNNSIYKIADLGFCKHLQAADQQSRLQLGSLFTMAPEIFNDKPYGLQSDMFSMGVIFYQILYNRFPFKQQDYYLQDSQPKINFEKNNIEISDKTKDLLQQMLQFNPQKRITFKDLIYHPAFEKPFFSLISKIQFQANRIPLDDFGEFYKERSIELEANYEKKVDHQQKQQFVAVQQQSQKLQSQRNCHDIDMNKVDISKLGLETDQITQKINQMYFFSNTFQESVQVLQSPQILVLLCSKLQKLSEYIINRIIENIVEYQNNKQYEQDFKILEEQYREMVSLSEGIIYQHNFIQEQLKNFGENSYSSSSQNDLQELEFNNFFSKLLSNYLKSQNNNITNALSHLILCFCYCVTKDDEYLEFNETTFDLKKSNQKYEQSDELLQQFQLFSNEQNY